MASRDGCISFAPTSWTKESAQSTSWPRNCRTKVFTFGGTKALSFGRDRTFYSVFFPSLLDVIRGSVENVRDSPHRRVLSSVAPRFAECHSSQSNERTVQFAHVSTRVISHGVANPLKDVIQYVPVLIEKFLALRRDVIDLFAVGFHGANVALILEQLERWVDAACRRRVAAGHF